MGWNPVREAQKAARRAVDKIVNPAANAARSLVNRAGDEVKNGVRNVGREIEGGVKRVGGEVEGGLKKVGGDIEDSLQKVGREAEEGMRKAAEEVQDAFDDRLPDIAEEVMDKIPELADEVLEVALSTAFEQSIKKALGTAMDVVEILAPDSFTLIFGAEAALIVQAEFTVSVSFPNPVAKLTEIRKWAKNPPSGRAQIMACIKDFGPEELAAEAKVSGNGFAASWNGEDKYEKIDAFLAKQGVN